MIPMRRIRRRRASGLSTTERHADPLAGTIVSTFNGTDLADLDAGSARVQAVDDSKLQLSITAADGSVSLDLDSDGDGAYEDTVATNWNELY